MHVIGHAGQFFGAGVVGKRVRGVKGVFAEFLAQGRLAFLDLGKTLSRRALQLRATQHEVAQRIVMGLSLFGVEGLRVNCLVLGVEALICAKPGIKLGDLGQHHVVGGTQFRRVGHSVEVGDCAPGSAQAVSRHIQHRRDSQPAGNKVGRCDGFKRGVGISQQCIDGGFDVLRLNLVKQRQIVKGKQGIVHGKWGVATRSAASRVLTSNMVMVMGPTPPGTGLM